VGLDFPRLHRRNPFYPAPAPLTRMAQEKRSEKGQGFQAAAGLMRYFDAEDDRAVKIPPQGVMLFCVVTVAVVGLAAAFIRV